MDNVKFEHSELVATKNVSTECNVTVIPLAEDNFTITLEIGGTDVWFVTPGGTNQKSVRTFDSLGFKKPRLCEMNLNIGTNKRGTTVTTISVRTQSSNNPTIKLTVNNSPAT